MCKMGWFSRQYFYACVFLSTRSPVLGYIGIQWDAMGGLKSDLLFCAYMVRLQIEIKAIIGI